MKKILTAGLVGALALFIIGAAIHYWPSSRGGGLSILPRPKVDEEVTLSILHSEAMAFLVTRRTVTQIVVEHEESNLLGDWKGVLWATVSWHWGVDLQKITRTDIRREGNTIYCHLPDPQPMEGFSVEPGSVGFMSRSTALPKLMEVLGPGTQRQKLEERLKAHAMQFAKDNKLIPTREETVRQVNDVTKVLRQGEGVEIRFE